MNLTGLFYFIMNIKFRALKKNGKGFVYGHYIANNIDAPCIIDEDANQYEILPDTVGMYIGIEDIYEWDIDKSGDVMMWNEKLCLFCLHTFRSHDNEFKPSSYPIDLSRIEIIGNIHENPKLVKI